MLKGKSKNLKELKDENRIAKEERKNAEIKKVREGKKKKEEVVVSSKKDKKSKKKK